MPGSHILVVDDTPELLRLLSSYLPRYGHTVKCCGTGTEALAAIRAPEQQPFNLAILDLSLPDIDGRELAGIILRENHDIAVLIASGSHMPKAALGKDYAQRTAVLMKPYHPKALIEAIDGLLSGSSVGEDLGYAAY